VSGSSYSIQHMHKFVDRQSITRNTSIIVLLSLACIQAGSQSGNAQVVITGVPQWGQNGTITGYVSGLSSNLVTLRVFEFIPDMGWYDLSGCGPKTIKSTGEFTVEAGQGTMDRNATRFSAYLLPNSLAVGCVQGSGSIPFLIQQNALSVSSVPRIAQYSTVSFGGLTWYVKTAPVPVYPGPQFYVQQNAFVDSLGQLHLRLTKCGDSWCAGEVFTTQNVGYGTYSFSINSAVNNLDPNVTLGLFTWDGQAGDQNYREWDIEFGRWGNANAAANAQYVVQPYNATGNISKFLMSPAAQSTHTVNWSPNGLQFRSSSNAGQISQFTYSGSPAAIPNTGDVRLHMNLYVGVGSAPTVALNQEIVISSFQYTPTGSQTGFSRTSDAAPFLASSRTVPTRSLGTNCLATVESDSPWLTVTSPILISGGQNVEYSIPDNIGTPRTGNLILQSPNCGVELNSQVLTVTQQGFFCNPTFDSSSTSVGFLQSARSVLIRGTASACSWTVTSAAPWLKIIGAASGSGDGNIQISADPNNEFGQRVGTLFLGNGDRHFVNQDASGSSLALSPLAAASCGGQLPQFAVSWVSPGNVEIRLGSPGGQLFGQFSSYGSALLPTLADGTGVYLLAGGTSQPLASARVSILPANCSLPTVLAQGIVNAASFAPISLAPGTLATIRGTKLTTTTAQANGPQYPTALGGISVLISGVACPLLYASPSQINFLVPGDLPFGRHLLTVGTASADVIISKVSPGVFTLSANGTGVPLASLVTVNQDGSTTNSAPYRCDANGCTPATVTLPSGTTALYVVLYGTGIRNAQRVAASLGQAPVQVPYFGAQSQYPGLDQVNLFVTNTSSLRGRQSLTLLVDDVFSNSVDLLFP
jgi:uncharacterized protein (TIGR03437 family)